MGRSRSRDRRRSRDRDRDRRRRSTSRDRARRKREKEKAKEKAREENEIAKRVEQAVSIKFSEHIESEEFKSALKDKLKAERQRLEALVLAEIEEKKKKIINEFTRKEEEVSRSKIELEQLLIENQKRVLEEQAKRQEEQIKTDQMFRVEVDRINKQTRNALPQGPARNSGRF